MTREDLCSLVAGVPHEALPGLIGDLAAAQAEALARLTASAPAGNGRAAEEPERQLTPEQAAEVIGGVSPRWVLRHTKGSASAATSPGSASASTRPGFGGG